MSLISLLIALSAERHLASPFWQFHALFSKYMAWIESSEDKLNLQGYLLPLFFVALPVLACWLILTLVDDSIIHLALSTIILIVCLGCAKTRACYKKYLQSAYRGELTTCDLHYQQLISDKNLLDKGFGQTLIWLNYRYYIAIMLFFIAFGAVGAVFYRLMCALDEQKAIANSQDDMSPLESISSNETYRNQYRQILFWLDWLPVRITSFGFMLVGHFSKAMPTWLENLFEINKVPQSILIDVAQKSEDMMVDASDCTAEPCLLVRLAKRNLLLILATAAVLTLFGIIQ